MAQSKYASTKETTNLARLARMILGPCTDLLRAVLLKEIFPSNLPHKVKTFLSKLPAHIKSPITKEQQNLIHNKNYSDFDITLLYFLLRNISTIPQHFNKWGNDPQPTDRSVSANIERIRLIRNEYGHISNILIPDKEFKSKWQHVFDIVKDLENYLGGSKSHQDAIVVLKTCSMDSELEELQDLTRKMLEKTKENENVCVPKNVKDMHDIDISKWKEDDRFFVELQFFPTVLDQVRKQSYVVFVGVQGSGKTATVRHIALLLQKEGYEIVILRDVRLIETYSNPKKPQLFVIDDVVGKFLLEKSELNALRKYEDRIMKPVMPKSKTLMTCRTIVFRNKRLSNHFVSEGGNVVDLHILANNLTNRDKDNIRAMYNSKNIKSSNNFSQTSKMFPFVCNLSTKKTEYISLVPNIVTSVIPCIIKELDDMKTTNAIQYASLVLLMVNRNNLPKQYLENVETNAHFTSMKFNVLKECKVKSRTDSLKITDALSEMKGTYTLECDNNFTFVNDCMFKIIAYHFGVQCPELILEYMSSDYIASYIKVVERDQQQKLKEIKDTKKQKTVKNNEDVIISEKEKRNDLCITLHESRYQLLAARLFRDLEDGYIELVFGNEALKQTSVLREFIAIMKRESYQKLCIMFLEESDESLTPGCVNEIKQLRLRGNTDYPITRLLKNEVSSQSRHRKSVRAISWIILYGHHHILRFFIDEIIEGKAKGTANDLFKIHWNESKKGDSVLKKPDMLNTCTSKRSSSCHKKTKNYMHFNPLHFFMSLLMCCLPRKVKQDNDTDLIRDQDKTMVAKSKAEADNTIYNTVKLPIASTGTQNTLKEQWRLLCLSCYSGIIQTVQILLKHLDKAAINYQTRYTDCFINSPLAIASELGNLDIVKELLRKGADVNRKTGFHTPLTVACENGHLKVVEELVKMGADVNMGTNYHQPLTIACEKGHIVIIEHLLKAGADVNVEKNFYRPLTIAIEKGHDGVIEILKKYGAKDVNDFQIDAKSVAIPHGQSNILNKLFNEDFYQDKNKTTAVWCHTGQFSSLKESIKSKSNSNSGNSFNISLAIACYGGYLNIVNWLITIGAYVNFKYDNTTPLIIACIEGHLDIVDTLIREGADVNLQGGLKTPLTAASYNRREVIVGRLIRAGADVNQNDDDSTPLTVASYVGCLNIVEQLIKKGAVVNAIHNGKTALTIASERGHQEIVRKLIEANADVNQKSKTKTPLTAACYGGQSDIVEELIKAGANVNQQDTVYSPLTVASKMERWGIVEKLMKAGASDSRYPFNEMTSENDSDDLIMLHN